MVNRKSTYIIFGLQFLLVLGISIGISFFSSNVHYRTFSTAGNFLLHGENPYLKDWGYGWQYFYSPVCGWFFGLFYQLKNGWGSLLYFLLSYAVFTMGCLKLFQDLKTPNKNTFIILSLLVINNEIIGAFQCSKLEIAMLGILMLVTSMIEKKPVLAACLSALMINFKFFPVAPVGLLAITQFKSKNYKFLIYLPLFIILFFALPIVPYGLEFTKELYRTQHQVLNEFVEKAYLDFPSIFGLLWHKMGIRFEFKTVQYILLIASIPFALLTYFYSKKDAKYFALSLGVLYVVNFNLLSQTSAYLITTPAVIYCLYLLLNSKKPEKYYYVMALVIYWIFVSFLTSDFTPRPIREHFHTFLLKPIGGLVLLLAIVRYKFL
jgi:hypothetical protein